MVVQHVDLTDPYLHEPKGAAAAVLNSVYKADGAGSGSFEKIVPDNLVMVHSSSDLPTPSAGLITLADNTVYQVVGSVSLGSNRIAMGDLSVLIGINQDYDKLVSTTTGVMITSTDVTSRVVQLGLTCASGTLFDVDGTGAESFDCIRVNAVCDTIGDFDNMENVDIFRSTFDAASAGMTFTGAHSDLELRESTVDVAATNGTCVDLGTATFNNLIIEGTHFENPTGTGYGIDVAASGANINAGFIGFIESCTFANDSNASNYVAGDIRWITHASVGVAPSLGAATGYIAANATATAFSGTGAGNDVVANFGTGFTARTLQRKFTTANTGLTTYNGQVDTLVSVAFKISGIIAGGAARTYNFYVAKNGTIQEDSFISQQFDGTNARNVTCTGLLSIASGDVISLRVRAETATTSITLQNVSMTILQVDQ